MRLTALQPPPPTPITLILATLLGTILLLLLSSRGLFFLSLLKRMGTPEFGNRFVASTVTEKSSYSELFEPTEVSPSLLLRVILIAGG